MTVVVLGTPCRKKCHSFPGLDVEALEKETRKFDQLEQLEKVESAATW